MVEFDCIQPATSKTFSFFCSRFKFPPDKRFYAIAFPGWFWQLLINFFFRRKELVTCSKFKLPRFGSFYQNRERSAVRNLSLDGRREARIICDWPRICRGYFHLGLCMLLTDWLTVTLFYWRKTSNLLVGDSWYRSFWTPLVLWRPFSRVLVYIEVSV